MSLAQETTFHFSYAVILFTITTNVLRLKLPGGVSRWRPGAHCTEFCRLLPFTCNKVVGTPTEQARGVGVAPVGGSGLSTTLTQRQALHDYFDRVASATSLTGLFCQGSFSGSAAHSHKHSRHVHARHRLALSGAMAAAVLVLDLQNSAKSQVSFHCITVLTSWPTSAPPLRSATQSGSHTYLRLGQAAASLRGAQASTAVWQCTRAAPSCRAELAAGCGRAHWLALLLLLTWSCRGRCYSIDLPLL